MKFSDWLGRSAESGKAETALRWSSEPGFHERQLLIRYNNAYFPLAVREVSQQELSEAQKLDNDGPALLEKFVATWLDVLRDCKDLTLGQAVSLLKEIDTLTDLAYGMGPKAHGWINTLEEWARILETFIEKAVDQSTGDHLKAIRATLVLNSGFMRSQGYIDVTRARPNELMPTLLSCSVEEMKFLFQELPPELADVSAGWSVVKKDLKKFALTLVRESPEARDRLLSEPAKLEFLGIPAMTVID